MWTKPKIFNAALSALLLRREITDADADTSNEARVLRLNYDFALYKALEDLDLDSTSSQVELTLVEESPEDFLNWNYVYSYPTNCALFRRIKSEHIQDCRATHIPKLVRLYGTPPAKCIFTNEPDAVAEFIPTDLPLTVLSSNAGQAIAHYLAWLSAPLIVGKGAERLKKEIWDKYMVLKADAQKHDRIENGNFIDERIESEFVNERMS